MAQPSLFDEESMPSLMLAPGAFYLPRLCLHSADQLWQLVSEHLINYPATHMMTPMGYPMSVKTSSMGHWGWVSDSKGYGYQPINPVTNLAWPPIPTTFLRLAEQAANAAANRFGFTGYRRHLFVWRCQTKRTSHEVRIATWRCCRLWR